MSENEIAKVILDEAFRLHRMWGPGLLESAYEKALIKLIEKRGLNVESQISRDIVFEDIKIMGAYKIDLMVEDKVVVELKSVSENKSVFAKQLKTYLVLSDKKLGILINFGSEYLRDGVKRVANGLNE